ncbi:hypothetical protein ATANTOWER_005065 [Ataeniobius toweri]|uniref:Uncharacterized protein n=1 Tax=Ataeniobius toweri TaxID=208326 RepID=A0ABU7BPU2_9TELE|nr:hypothetical protein [Ataeniobius toweri]
MFGVVLHPSLKSFTAPNRCSSSLPAFSPTPSTSLMLTPLCFIFPPPIVFCMCVRNISFVPSTHDPQSYHMLFFAASLINALLAWLVSLGGKPCMFSVVPNPFSYRMDLTQTYSKLVVLIYIPTLP